VKKTSPVLVFVLLILEFGPILISVGRANPYLYDTEKGNVTPPSDVSPPAINIYSPQKNSTITSNNVTLTFNLNYAVPTLPELFYCTLELEEVYYEASWLSNKTNVDIKQVTNSTPHERFFSEQNFAQWSTYWAIKGYELSHNFSISLEGAPKGSRWLKVSAVLVGSRQTRFDTSRYPTIIYGYYRLVGYSQVTFSVDCVTVLSPRSQTYDASDVSLLFEVPTSINDFAYSLDWQDRIATSGNTTLSGLCSGNHNVTVYVTDEAGNTGASETVFFDVEVPFPILPVAAVSVAVAAVVAVAVLVYQKKRMRGANT
jgi:hypothetical protein